MSTAGSEGEIQERERKGVETLEVIIFVDHLIQSRVKCTKLMNIMVIQMNGAMRKINY